MIDAHVCKVFRMFWNLRKVHSVSELGMKMQRNINNQMNVGVFFQSVKKKKRKKDKQTWQ